MTSEAATGTPGFWYDDESQISGMDVLNALRRYRTAENSAQRRARDALGMGENAMLAVRMLLLAEQDDRTVNAKQLAEHLGITSASTSALVDRLVRSGHVVRHADPEDRRGVILTATGSHMSETLATISELDARTLDAVENLSQPAMSVVVAFLEEMSQAVDDADVPDDIRSLEP